MLRHAKVEPLPGFVDAGELVAQVFEAARPPARTRVSEWAESRRQLRNRGAYSGPWRNARTPYMVEPMDMTASRAKEEVVIVGPGQFGKTEVGLNVIGHGIEIAPRDMLVIQYSRDMAIEFSQTRLDARLLKLHPSLSALLGGSRSDDKDMTKTFRNGMQISIGWPVVGQLSSRPVGLVWIDELDRMPDDVGGEGDPLELGKTRLKTFKRNGMQLATSSPGGSAKKSKIIKRWQAGDRRLYFVPCEACGEHFSPGFGPDRRPTLAHIHVPKNCPAEEIPERAGLMCPHCGVVHDEAAKRRMVGQGVWLPDGQSIDAAGNIHGRAVSSPIASYWLSGLCIPFETIGSLAQRIARAEKRFADTGDESVLKTVYNTGLGFPYEERAGQAEAPVEAAALKERAESWPVGVVPEGGRFVVVSADVQVNRFEVLVRAFGAELESWILDRFALFATTGESGKERMVDPATQLGDWALLEALLERGWPLAGGRGEMAALRLVVDTGGAKGVTANAYDWYRSLRKRGLSSRVILAKGRGTRDAPRLVQSFPDSKRKDRKAKARGEVPMWLFQSNLLKDELDAQLRVEAPGRRYVHLPRGLVDDTDRHGAFFDELTAEERDANGAWSKKEGVQRNETLDLMVLSHVGALQMRADRIDWTSPPAWAAAWWDAEPAVGKDAIAPAAENALAIEARAEVKKQREAMVASRRRRGFVGRW